MSDDERDDITASFALVMRLMADLSLRVETGRVLLKAQGVTDEEYALVHDELKKRSDAQADELAEQIKRTRTAAEMRRLLESAGGTKQ